MWDQDAVLGRYKERLGDQNWKVERTQKVDHWGKVMPLVILSRLVVTPDFVMRLFDYVDNVFTDMWTMKWRPISLGTKGEKLNWFLLIST